MDFWEHGSLECHEESVNLKAVKTILMWDSGNKGELGLKIFVPNKFWLAH